MKTVLIAGDVDFLPPEDIAPMADGVEIVVVRDTPEGEINRKVAAVWRDDGDPWTNLLTSLQIDPSSQVAVVAYGRGDGLADLAAVSGKVGFIATVNMVPSEGSMPGLADYAKRAREDRAKLLMVTSPENAEAVRAFARSYGEMACGELTCTAGGIGVFTSSLSEREKVQASVEAAKMYLEDVKEPEVSKTKAPKKSSTGAIATIAVLAAGAGLLLIGTD